jgi:hypothetical protein
MANAAKSAYLQIYDEETKHDDYKFEMKNAQAKMSFSDSKMDRPMEFKAGSYKFKFGATLTSEFDLKSKLDEIEGDIDDLEADTGVQVNATSIAAETVARIAADTVLTNGAAAEVARATTAEQANAAAVVAEAALARAAEAANAAAVVSAAGVAAAATAAEAVTARAAEAALSTQISSLLSNADPALVDSIAELLSHVNSADASLIATIAALQASHDALLARVDELTNE